MLTKKIHFAIRRIAEFCLALVLVSLSSTPRAHADRATFSIAYGGTVGEANGNRDWKPSLWIDGAANLVGPLQLGAYVQAIGQEFGLKDPSWGGGGLLQLRPTFGIVHVIAAFNFGRQKYPVKNADDDGVWAIGAMGGLGVGLLEWFGLEARARYNRYTKERSMTPRDNWTIEGAAAFYIP